MKDRCMTGIRNPNTVDSHSWSTAADNRNTAADIRNSNTAADIRNSNMAADIRSSTAADIRSSNTVVGSCMSGNREMSSRVDNFYATPDHLDFHLGRHPDSTGGTLADTVGIADDKPCPRTSAVCAQTSTLLDPIFDLPS